jgi:hypothetical protein
METKAQLVDLINKKLIEYNKELEKCREIAQFKNIPKGKEEFLVFCKNSIELKERISYNVGAITALKILLEEAK